jgi:Ca2+-transporting ATPase
MEQWHSLSIDKALEQLGSRRSGLTETEAKKRLSRYGYNKLKGKEKTRPIVVFLKQFLSPLIYILMAAVIISLIAQHYMDALVILAVLLFNAVFGCIQELRAEKAMEALMQMAAPKTKVRRDGKVKEILAKEVVPHIAYGDR